MTTEPTLTTQPKETTKRQERAYRILDAASALITRLGYDKTTMDDIARQSGVAKGTLYLHWKTREDLFRTLVQREAVEVGEDVRQRILADPAGVTLRGIYKSAALALLKRPFMKALLFREQDVLGKLAHAAHPTAAYAEKLSGFNIYLQFLREHNLLRTDIDLRVQVATVSAILTGFFLSDGMMPDELKLSDEETAEMIGEAIHRTLESDRIVPPDEYQAIARAFFQYFDQIMATAQSQLQQEIK